MLVSRQDDDDDIYIYIYIYIYMIQGGNPKGKCIQYECSILTAIDV